jgi:hypothetical protein
MTILVFFVYGTKINNIKATGQFRQALYTYGEWATLYLAREFQIYQHFGLANF